MADWTLPIETTQYLQVLANLKDRDIDAATWGGYVNPPVNALRFDRASGHPYVIQEWDGAAWQNKIISVASGGTGSTNLNDFKASLGLGSMAYQNANNVAITGGTINGASVMGNSIINVVPTAKFENGQIVLADASGVAIKIGARVSDGYMAIIFNSRDMATEYGRIYTSTVGRLNTTAHIMPTADNTLQLGEHGNSWKFIYSRFFSATSNPDSGYFVDNHPQFGFYYSPTYGGLVMNSAAASGIPAIIVGHTTSNMAFGGDVYPRANKAQSFGLDSNNWFIMHAQYHNAPGDGAFIFNNNSASGFFAHSGLYPAVKYGPTPTQYWAGDHTVILGTLYLPEKHWQSGSIINQTTVSNFISFHAAGFALNTPGGYTFGVQTNSVTIEGNARFGLSHLNASDTLLKWYWIPEPLIGMWLSGAGQTAIWHFNAAGYRLLQLHAYNTTFVLPVVGLYHTTPLADAALWMGYPAVPYRWYSIALIAAPSVGSDKRDKDILGSEKLGLNFINRLEPIMYRLPGIKWRDDNKKIWHGLAAQDVEKVLNKLGIDFAGLLNEDDNYSLRYTEFIGPIIKAIQELDRKVEDAKAEFLSRK